MKNSSAVLTQWFNADQVAQAAQGDIAQWLLSEDGRRALSEAVTRASEAANRLDEARKVTAEQLRVPVTL